MTSLARQVLCGWLLVLTTMVSGCGGVGGVEPTTPPPASSPATSRGPTIHGQPSATVSAGQAYTFVPVASSGDGSNLVFSASNLPAWLTIDTRTGRLSGTPSMSDVGTYSGLTITASNGSAVSASLGPFSITVGAMGDGRATVSWQAPSTNTDGSVLTDLAGFMVVYGTSPADLSYSISISNPSVSTYVVENLGPGTWYFAVRAVNAAGVASAPSSTASKSIG